MAALYVRREVGREYGLEALGGCEAVLEMCYAQPSHSKGFMIERFVQLSGLPTRALRQVFEKLMTYTRHIASCLESEVGFVGI